MYTHTPYFIKNWLRRRLSLWRLRGATICRRETWGSWWCNQKAKIWSQWCIFESSSEGLRTRNTEGRRFMSPLHSQVETGNASFLHLLFYFRPQWIA